MCNQPCLDLYGRTPCVVLCCAVCVVLCCDAWSTIINQASSKAGGGRPLASGRWPCAAKIPGAARRSRDETVRLRFRQECQSHRDTTKELRRHTTYEPVPLEDNARCHFVSSRKRGMGRPRKHILIQHHPERTKREANAARMVFRASAGGISVRITPLS